MIKKWSCLLLALCILALGGCNKKKNLNGDVGFQEVSYFSTENTDKITSQMVEIVTSAEEWDALKQTYALTDSANYQYDESFFQKSDLVVCLLKTTLGNSYSVKDLKVQNNALTVTLIQYPSEADSDYPVGVGGIIQVDKNNWDKLTVKELVLEDYVIPSSET